MKTNIRILALFLSLILAFGLVLTSCKNNDDMPDNDSESESVSETEQPAEPQGPILIADKGTVNFGIIYNEDVADDVKTSVTSLYDALVKRSGGGMPNIGLSDYQTYNAETKEILIGDTDYPESNEVMSTLGYGEWTVCFVGNKLVVAGFSRAALSTAVTEVIKYVKNGATDDGSIEFSADLNVTKSIVEVANHLPRFEDSGYPQVADEGRDTALVVMSDMTADGYSAYLTKVASEGFTLYTTNTIGDNKFSTYVNDEYMIHAGYYAYESATRVTIEKRTNLPTLESENVYTKNDNIVTSLAQVGVGEEVGNGMSYCYQLADGSFLVIDGGFADDAKTLYDYMKAKAPGDEIVIAAWIVSHNHNDHYSAFVEFNTTYKTDVKVEQVILNFPASMTYFESEQGENSSTLVTAGSLSGCKIIKAHTGQRFYIRNAVVEMLYTIDSYLPEMLTYFNNTSLVFTVDVEGERALYMCDASDPVAKILRSMYGSYLKSDMLQLAHHGIRNGHGTNMPETIKLYALIRPEIVFWPTSNNAYLDRTVTEAYQPAKFKWNIEAMKSARESYIASDVITVLELPYSMFSSYIFDPDNPNPTPVRADTASSTDSLTYKEICGDTVLDRVDWND